MSIPCSGDGNTGASRSNAMFGSVTEWAMAVVEPSSMGLRLRALDVKGISDLRR